MTLYNHPTDVFCSGRRTSVLKSKTPVNVNNWGKKKTPSEVIVKQSSCGGVLTVLLKSKHDSGNKVTHYLRPHPDPLISLEEVKY